MVSHSYINEFKIWDVKNYERLKTYKEDSNTIRRIIITADNNIITLTNNYKINVWKI
jgi:hypothetical protein